MTEAEWLQENNLVAMLSYLTDKATERNWRLTECAARSRRRAQGQVVGEPEVGIGLRRSEEPAVAKAFLVQKVSWTFVDNAEPLWRDEEGAGIPIKVFMGREKAQAHCRKLHRAARKKVIPFQHGAPFRKPNALPSLASYTSMSNSDYLRLIEECRLEPPDLPPPGEEGADASSYAAWCSWWYEGAKVWPPAVLDRLWDALDRVVLFEVVAVPAEL